MVSHSETVIDDHYEKDNENDNRARNGVHLSSVRLGQGVTV